MAIPIKKSSVQDKQTVTSSLPGAVQSQIENNTKLDTTDYTKLETQAAETEETVTTESKKSEEKGKRTDDLVQLKFSKGKRAEAKAFFATNDVKMNAGFEMAYEFLKEEVAAGNVKLSKSGIQRIKK